MACRPTTRSITALITAATLTASCATSPPPPPMPPGATQTATAQKRAAEDVVANYIYSQLNADPVYYYRHVDVKVSGDVAILSGYVWESQAIYRAREIAGQVPGITRVVTNQLELERNGNKSGVTR